MGNPISRTRDLIAFRLNLHVLFGELDEEIGNIWISAIESLDDVQLAELIRRTDRLNKKEATRVTIQFLMQNHYPFRELVLYRTDEAFKKRMGLQDLDSRSLH